jgi:uncharacterized protein (DUF1778 family)
LRFPADYLGGDRCFRSRFGRPETNAWHRATFVYTLYTHEDHTLNAPVIREKTINLRTTSAQKAVIEQAAKTSGKTRTAFILDATLQRAEAVLADRTHAALPDAQMRRFVAALDAPLPSPDALRALLSRKPRWTR